MAMPVTVVNPAQRQRVNLHIPIYSPMPCSRQHSKFSNGQILEIPQLKRAWNQSTPVWFYA